MRTPASPLSRAIATVIGARLWRARTTQGLTQALLAELSGLDSGTISRMERGLRMGPLGGHLRLSRALGLTLAELYADLETLRSAQQGPRGGGAENGCEPGAALARGDGRRGQ